MEEVQNSNESGLVRKTLFLFVTALIALCMFQSSALLTLTYDLPAGDLTEKIIFIAEGWNNLMHRFGAAKVTESISEVVTQIHDLQIED